MLLGKGRDSDISDCKQSRDSAQAPRLHPCPRQGVKFEGANKPNEGKCGVVDESIKNVVSDAKHASSVQLTFPYDPFRPTTIAGAPVLG